MSFARRMPPTDGRYVAARPLDFGDRKIAEGEVFPWREMAMDEREVQRRWWVGELDAAPVALEPAQPGTMQTATVQPESPKPSKRRWR